MKKIVDLLEQHVQWLALGLGAIYLLYMAYLYVIQTPVSQNLNGTEVTLGNVDDETARGPAQRLNQAMSSSEPVTFPSVNLAASFLDQMDNSRTKYASLTLPGTWLFTQNQKLSTPKIPGVITPGNKDALANLANPPAPDVVDIAYGRSTVIVPPPQPAANAAAAANPQPNAVQPVATNEDKNWATSQYKLSMSQLAQSFRNAHIPQNQNLTTCFLRVELQRQELLSSGTWGNDKTIEPLAANQLQPYPPANNPGVEADYNAWAEQNQKLILMPPFYAIAKGNPWHVPTEKIEETVRKYDPADPTMQPQTPEERAMKKKYDDEQRRKNAPARSTTPHTPGSARPGGATGLAYRETDGPVLLAQLEGDVPRGGRGYYGPGLNPGAAAGPQQSALNPSEALTKLQSNVPTAAFNPFDAKLPDVDIIAHDDSCEPGKTYRYRIRYTVRNPLYGRPDLAKPEIAKVFGLPSQYSQWTTPVAMPTNVNFFLALGGFSRNSNAVTFKIYKYQNGHTTSEKQQASPGDMIGHPGADADYTTRWTLVDIRDNYVLLADPDGKTADATGKPYRRDFRTDEADPLNKKLDIESKQPASVAGVP